MATTKYSVGDKVKVKPGKDHDGMGEGETGTIQEISTPALGVKFPSMSEVHKWYTDDEVESATTPDDMDVNQAATDTLALVVKLGDAVDRRLRRQSKR